MKRKCQIDSEAVRNDLRSMCLDDRGEGVSQASIVNHDSAKSMDGPFASTLSRDWEPKVADDNGRPPATQDTLCEACQKIDFEAATRREDLKYQFWKKKDAESCLWSLGPQSYKQLATSGVHCRLCRFFAGFFEEIEDEAALLRGCLDPLMVFLKNDGTDDLSPWAFAFDSVTFGLGYSRPYFCLHTRFQNPNTNEGIWDRIQLCRRPGAERPPLGFRVPTPRVPYDLMRSWLDFCQCHHGPRCSEGGETTLRSLRVVDCEPATAKVVLYSPGLGRYAALSYVWGQSLQAGDAPRVSASGELPPVLPRTIHDAIAVARKLGFRYLWVDQYCIPQDDEDERARQIRCMDEVYRGAELTIVASAGTHADHGLPGVGSVARQPPKSVRVGAYTLVDMPTDAFSLLNGGATWPRRGWTYQEGVLSRRRLVFTENQVYFQCEGMNVWEGLDIPLDLLHYETQQATGCREAKAFTTLEWFQHQREASTVDYHILSYLATELTWPDDAIRAISGIFSHFNKTRRTILVLSGLPLYITHDARLGPPTFSKAHATLLSLAWYFSHSPQVRRRKVFPSWTWAGWQKAEGVSGIGFQRASHPRMIVEPLHATPAIKVGTTAEDDRSTLLWQELDELPWEESGGQLVAPYITLTGWTFKVTVAKKRKQGGSRADEDEFSIMLPGNLLSHDYSFEPHAHATGLADGSELVAVPLYWEFEANLDQAEMPVLLLYHTSREVASRKVHERVGLARCWFREGNLTALREEIGDWQLPPWARGVFQTVCIG